MGAVVTTVLSVGVLSAPVLSALKRLSVSVYQIPGEDATVGRTRTFDLDAALDQAMLIFWRLGFERAPMTDLTRAIGINRPSLCAAFGNKEELFRKALQRYAEGPGLGF
jgi:hypothetical protein